MFTKRLFSSVLAFRQLAGAPQGTPDGENQAPIKQGKWERSITKCKATTAAALLGLSCHVGAQDNSPTAPKTPEIGGNTTMALASTNMAKPALPNYSILPQAPSPEALAKYSDRYILDLYNEGVSKKMQYKEGIVDPDGKTDMDYITLFLSEDIKPLLKKLRREDKDQYSEWSTKVIEAGMGRGFGNTGMRYQFESIRDGLAKIASLDKEIADGEEQITKDKAKTAEDKAKTAEDKAKTAEDKAKTAEDKKVAQIAREAKNLLNFVGYSVLISIGNNTTPEQNKEYGNAFERILSDETARKVFETDETLELAITLRDALLRGDTLIQIRKDLLQSIARVVVLKQGIIKQADAINPGTELGFRGPLSKLAEISGVTITGT